VELDKLYGWSWSAWLLLPASVVIWVGTAWIALVWPQRLVRTSRPALSITA
jgi:hypothetical protein